MKDQVGYITTGQRSNYLLIEGLERLDVEVELVARGLLEIGNRLAKRRILGRNEALSDLNCCCRCLGAI